MRTLRHAPKASPGKKPRRVAKRAASVRSLVVKRLASWSRAHPGRVTTPFDFRDLGSPHSVGMVLMRLVRSGKLRRLARGYYDVPRTHPSLGVLEPSPTEIANAIARRDGALIQPADEMAANLLSVSDHVPARAVFSTTGPSRTLKIRSVTVRLFRKPPRKIGKPSAMSAMVFAALRALGKREVSMDRVEHLSKTLSKKDRRRLLDDIALAPAWMHPFVRFIAVANDG